MTSTVIFLYLSTDLRLRVLFCERKLSILNFDTKFNLTWHSIADLESVISGRISLFNFEEGNLTDYVWQQLKI